jgi:hypothetical protein
MSELESEIATAANELGAKAPSFGPKGKTYETWVMFEMASLLSKNMSVEPKSHDGKSPRGHFRIRGGPGIIPVPAARGKQPCHFEITVGGPLFELHNSLVHAGGSDEGHELDLSIVPQKDANAARMHGTVYRGGRLFGAELKAFDESRAIEKGIARGLIGLIVDLDPECLIRLSVGRGGAAKVFPLADRRYAFMTTARVPSQARRLLETYGVFVGSEVIPADPIRIGDLIFGDLMFRLHTESTG